VASYRPEFSAPWIGQSNVSLVTLNRLGRRHAREFLAEVATDHSVPAVVAERIIEHADGMPLLIEELTKAALESADRVEPQITEMTVFATLQVSLLARLNRMPIAKRVGQIAAVIGREFSHRLLAAVAKMPDTTLSQGLGELVASGLVFCRGAPPNATYTFKHALVHEAAYQTILRGTRRRLHASTASIIQESLPEVALYQPEVLAHHFAAAGDDEQAVAWFLAAGDLATRRYAHAEARSQYRRALDTLGRTSETDDNRRRYIDATVKYTAVSYAAMNPNEHLDLLRIAEAAAHKLPAAASAAGEDSLRLARVSYSLGRTLHYLNRLPDAMRYYRNVLDMADVSGDDEMLGVCSGMVGRVLSIQGQFAEAASFLSRALPVLERLGVHSEYISALNFLGLTYAARGDYDAGLSIAERARRIAVDLDFPTAIAAIHILKWGIHQQGGNTCGMLESAQTIVSISERTGDKMYLYLGYGMLAWAEALLENPFVGLSHLERSREVRNELGGHAVLTDWFSALYAELLFRLGRPAEAIRVADDATVEATAAGDIFAEGMARRTWAASLMRLDGSNWSEAESQLERSLQAFLTGDAQVEAARTHLTWALLGKQRGSEITFLEHTRLAERVFGSSRLHREWEQVRIASPTIQTNKLRVLSDWGR
jgi:tetratricopeptide (TPR) repeat protein